MGFLHGGRGFTAMDCSQFYAEQTESVLNMSATIAYMDAQGFADRANAPKVEGAGGF